MNAIIHLKDGQNVLVDKLSCVLVEYEGKYEPTNRVTVQADKMDEFGIFDAAQYTFVGTTSTVAFLKGAIQFVEFKK